MEGCVWAVKMQTVLGGPGACSPGKILENLECLGLHFTRFDGGQRDK